MENIAAKSHLDALGDRLINKLDALETRLINKLDEWQATMIKCIIVQGVVIIASVVLAAKLAI